jgi:hypothetical protein
MHDDHAQHVPRLGEHTREVLADVIGQEPVDIARLLDAGTVCAYSDARSRDPATQ